MTAKNLGPYERTSLEDLEWVYGIIPYANARLLNAIETWMNLPGTTIVINLELMPV